MPALCKVLTNSARLAPSYPMVRKASASRRCTRRWCRGFAYMTIRSLKLYRDMRGWGLTSYDSRQRDPPHGPAKDVSMPNVFSLPPRPPSEEPRAPGLNSIEEILDELKAGRVVVILDGDDRENEGDLIMAAEHATPAAVAFMIR